ncbi:MAG TPA: DegT/DnrJ/EryC1/StrS aminotransferase family protein [Candidatus Binatia bacterium]|jgi:dTDP-4-amino-4,6-dideoxygalactose transaminase
MHPIRKDFLPLSRPTIGEEEIREVVETLRSGWITTGPKVAAFEERFRQYLEIPHAVAVSSGTAALHVALLGAGLVPGDEVITSSMTFAATANAVVLAGARPVLVDCESDTLNIGVAAVERSLTKKTKAIMPVHFAGQPCAMDEIMEIARRRSLLVIEDAAHALGAEYKGRKIGAVGDATIYSFHPIKSITTGEGGMIVLRDGDWADRMKLARFHGIRTSAWERQAGGKSPLYAVELPGLKYTMMDIQAAIGIHQLAKLDDFIARRTRLAQRYREKFKDIEGIRLLGSVPYAHKHAWHLLVVQVDTDRLDIGRDEFLEILKESNIGAGVHFPALHMQPYYQKAFGYRPGDFPHAKRAAERILSLPLFPAMTERDVDDVAATVEAILAEHRRV